MVRISGVNVVEASITEVDPFNSIEQISAFLTCDLNRSIIGKVGIIFGV